MMEKITDIRPSPIAGTWYSSNPNRLCELVSGYIENASIPDLSGKVVGLIAPHAGHQYSGAVAGHAFKTINGQSYEKVLVVSPLHQYHPHPVLTSAHDAYETPLGIIPVARELLNLIDTNLKTKTGVSLTPIRKDQEHSLEIELPFLQCALKNTFSLIPIMLRDQSREFAKILGRVLAEVIQEESCLLVASSDLSHFYPEPIANKLDQQVLEAIADFSPDKLFDLKERGSGQACGLAPIASVLWASKLLGADKVTQLNYNTSGAVTGDHSSVVGYGAAVITRTT